MAKNNEAMLSLQRVGILTLGLDFESEPCLSIWLSLHNTPPTHTHPLGPATILPWLVFWVTFSLASSKVKLRLLSNLPAVESEKKKVELFWPCLPSLSRRETSRLKCWSVCSWSSRMPFPSRNSSPPRFAPRSASTTPARGATSAPSSSTKRPLFIVRAIARSVGPTEELSVCLSAAGSHKSPLSLFHPLAHSSCLLRCVLCSQRP